tara:strand:+ start:10565 stop:12202 length:1638 start_codon:yes stop_codon:yes gene_type:complete
MALNPFFLQGTQSEQRLVQDLINEHLRFHGVDITYIPRKIISQDTILNEVELSQFDDNYVIEAYINTFEGHTGAGDILTKFGMSLRDELTVTISKERFEDFVTPFLDASDDIEVSTRPREGDLIYFPLGQRLFEVKFVEHEDPFYQLGKNYVYQLKCELYEFEGDDVLDTSIEEIDTVVEDEGYITSLQLVGIGATATGMAVINGVNGYVRRVFLNNDGSGYTSAPIIQFDESPVSGGTATAVAITTSVAGVQSIKEILLTNAGFGYTVTPNISIYSGGGTGAAATCLIESTQNGVISITVDDGGVGYTEVPVVTIGPPTAGATATSTISTGGTVTTLSITTPGVSYSTAPTVTIADPVGVGSTATATATIGAGGTISALTITSGGSGYSVAPVVTISNADEFKDPSLGSAVARAEISAGNVVTAIRIVDPGAGYASAPTLTIADPPLISGIGTYQLSEVITGSRSGTTAQVKSWDEDTRVLKITSVNGSFTNGEMIVGAASSARYAVDFHTNDDVYDKYTDNDEIETEADLIVDFTESNPFGNY